MPCQFSNDFRNLFQASAADVWRSGDWTGYYLQEGQAAAQDFTLNFYGDSFEGLGQDNIGFFLILGNVDRRRDLASWVKQYVGRHVVYYQGALSGDQVVGRWTIPGSFSGNSISDGFAVWPRARNDI